MPLIQWIMQNLSKTPETTGVAASGAAIVGTETFIISKAQVAVGGEAFYNKIASIIATGGLEGGGESLVNKSSGPNTTKKIRHLPGDVVYDVNNKPWVVVSFEFASSSKEAQYKITDTNRKEILYDSQLTEITSKYLDVQEIDALRKINSLVTRPLDNLPTWSGLQRRTVVRYLENASLCEDRMISMLKTQPLDNYPAYAGRRTIKV